MAAVLQGIMKRAVDGTTASALEAWRMDRLARYQRSRRRAFVESPPLTATGKVRKNLLRQWARGRREAVA